VTTDEQSELLALALLGEPPAPPEPAGLGPRRRRRKRNWPLIVGLVLGLAIVVLTLFHSSIEPYDPGAINIGAFLHPPSGEHLLGTDELGRDELSRVIAGFPFSIGVATIGVLIASVIGTALGLIGAGWEGWPRFVVRRFVDFGIAFPFLVIAVVIIVVVGDGFWQLSATLGIVAWPIFTRVTLAQGLVTVEQEYVLAARLMSVSPFRRAIRHILPAMRGTIVVMLAFVFADLLLLQSGLAFIGLGAPLGTPTWGNLLQDSQQYLLNGSWLMAAPAGAIVLSVITANLIGDGLARQGVGPKLSVRPLTLLLRPMRAGDLPAPAQEAPQDDSSPVDSEW
jgi:peptide/nickel transport system permease protein